MYKRLTLEGLEWVKYASKDMKKRTSKKRKHSKKRKYTKKENIKKAGIKLKNILRVYLKKIKQNKQNQLKELLKVIKKGNILTDPKLKSYKSKKSSWVVKFEKKYGEDIKSYKQIISNRQICKSIKSCCKKGKGAYYSSGSRPNQTAESWGKARMYYILWVVQQENMINILQINIMLNYHFFNLKINKQ